jgi:1,4-dihydroxy-2-naphthoate octaprenyltransferase
MKWNLAIWLRAIRFRFLAASAIAVSNGLVLTYGFQFSSFNISYAALTYIGIFCLHSSVDLFNDYWDFKRGIDLLTKKTRFSGGTGVLPEGLLKPHEIFRAAILFLILGLSIGIFFVYIKGYLVALILGFATLSIILYSTKLVNVGLGELFVGTKGMLIVIGAFYVQTGHIILESIVIGVVTGLLSSLVLYINSIPDVKADKTKGRKTLAIILEKHSQLQTLTFVLSLFVSIYSLTFIFYYLIAHNIYPFFISLLLIPFAINILLKFHIYLIGNKENDIFIEKIMEKTVLFSRLYGVSIIIGIVTLIIFGIKIN